MGLDSLIDSNRLWEEDASLKEDLSRRDEIESGLFYRIMKFIGLEKLADYLTLNDYEKAKDDATAKAIILTEYGR